MTEDELRVAVLGLDRAGAAWLDALRCEPGVRLVGAWDPDGARLRSAPPTVPLAASFDALIAGADVVLCATTDIPNERLDAALAAGAHLALEPGVVVEPSAADRIVALAAARRRAVVVLNPWSRDEDFLAAQAAAVRPEFGAVRRVDFRLWSPAAIPAPPAAGPGRRQAAPSLMLTEGAARIDQLARLVPSEPASVYCRVVEPGSGATEAPASDAGASRTALDGGELFLLVEFACGAIARLEVSRMVCASEPGAWSAHGGGESYARGRLFQRTDDGEVFEPPWTPPSADEAPLKELIQAVRRPDPPVDPHWRRAVRILAAARISAREGRFVRPDDPL